jgi:hypothetical protein
MVKNAGGSFGRSIKTYGRYLRLRGYIDIYVSLHKPFGLVCEL